MEKKNTKYKMVVILLIALLVASNVLHIISYNDREQELIDALIVLGREIAHMDLTVLDEVDHFVNELSHGYIHILTIEPVGFINYSPENAGFRTVMYNVTYNSVSVTEEANGPIEVWMGNYTYTVYMTFDVAVANNQKPMNEGNIYKFHYIYNTYMFFNVIYYEKIETGRIYW